MIIYLFLVTGTLHGSHVYATSEGNARRAFHKCYNGESIIDVYKVEESEELASL